MIPRSLSSLMPSVFHAYANEVLPIILAWFLYFSNSLFKSAMTLPISLPTRVDLPASTCPITTNDISYELVVELESLELDSVLVLISYVWLEDLNCLTKSETDITSENDFISSVSDFGFLFSLISLIFLHLFLALNESWFAKMYETVSAVA